MSLIAGWQAPAADAEIPNYAMRNTAVIVSKDEDFAQGKALTDEGPVVVRIPLPNTRRRDLLTWFERPLPVSQHLNAAIH
jgi:predicted nuclease of predicted toxin-antitoxin system